MGLPTLAHFAGYRALFHLSPTFRPFEAKLLARTIGCPRASATVETEVRHILERLSCLAVHVARRQSFALRHGCTKLRVALVRLEGRGLAT